MIFELHSHIQPSAIHTFAMLSRLFVVKVCEQVVTLVSGQHLTQDTLALQWGVLVRE